MKPGVLKGVCGDGLGRRQFLKAAGAATVLGAAGVLGGNLLLGCAPSRATPKTEVPFEYRNLRMVGGSLGSIGATTNMAMAQLFNRHFPDIEWSSSSGSTGTNPIYLTTGTIKLGVLTPANYVTAYGFDRIPESRVRSVNLPSPLMQYLFLIPQDKPWSEITEVAKGSSLGIDAAGAIHQAAEVWLKVSGLSKSDFKAALMPKTELADGYRTGKIDVVFTSLSGMTPFLMDMYTSQRKLKLMGLTLEQAAKAEAEQAFERLGFEAPAKSNLSEILPDVFKYDVVCPQQPNFLCCRDDFPDEIAYRMAKIIDEHNADLVQMLPAMKYATPQFHIQWARSPLDIHSGVAKYYREKGYLK